MKLKTRDGYVVEFSMADAKKEGLTYSQLKSKAAEAVNAVRVENKKCRDSIYTKDDVLKFTKTIETNVGFSANALDAALRNEDEEAVEYQLDRLKRDLKADLGHTSYKGAYSDATLYKLIEKYRGALKVLKDFQRPEAAVVEQAIEKLFQIWQLSESGYETQTARKPSTTKEKAARRAEIVEKYKTTAPKNYFEEDFEIEDSKKIKDLIPEMDPYESIGITSESSVAPESARSDIDILANQPFNIGRPEKQSGAVKLVIRNIYDTIEDINNYPKGEWLRQQGYTTNEAGFAIKRRFGDYLVGNYSNKDNPQRLELIDAIVALEVTLGLFHPSRVNDRKNFYYNLSTYGDRIFK